MKLLIAKIILQKSLLTKVTQSSLQQKLVSSTLELPNLWAKPSSKHFVSINSLNQSFGSWSLGLNWRLFWKFVDKLLDLLFGKLIYIFQDVVSWWFLLCALILRFQLIQFRAPLVCDHKVFVDLSNIKFCYCCWKFFQNNAAETSFQKWRNRFLCLFLPKKFEKIEAETGFLILGNRFLQVRMLFLLIFGAVLIPNAFLTIFFWSKLWIAILNVQFLFNFNGLRMLMKLDKHSLIQIDLRMNSLIHSWCFGLMIYFVL